MFAAHLLQAGANPQRKSYIVEITQHGSNPIDIIGGNLTN